MSQYAASTPPPSPSPPPRPVRGRTVVLAAVAVVILLVAGFTAGYLVARPAGGSGADLNARDACRLLERVQLPGNPEDPETLKGLDVDATWEAQAASALAQAAAHSDSRYAGLAEQAEAVAEALQVLNLGKYVEGVEAARAECSELGL